MDKVIGIDLGTTYSVIAHIVDGKPVVIPNAEGKPLTPSVVSFDKEGRVFVGEMACARALFDPERTVFSIKRQMGKDIKIHIDDSEYTPQTISAYILRKLKNDAEKYLGQPVGRAVITVPAYFNERARQATKEAGRIAGFEVLRILNEPTAATLAYGLGQKKGERVMVWDLGGGTFDVSILEFSDGVYEVKSTSGDTWLGGDDWTALIATLITERFEKMWGKRVSTRPEIRQRIKMAAEQAKIEITNKKEARVSIPSLEDENGHLCSLQTIIKQSEFDGMTQDLIKRLIMPVEAALRDSGLKFNDMDKIILVGGATRMPQIRELVTKMTEQRPFIDIDPDIVIGLGAAMQAGIITGEAKDAVLVDVVPLSLGIETRGGIFTRLIQRNSAIPTSYSQIFTTAMDDQTEVDIHVLQGERELAAHNVSLGKFCLTEIPPLPKGMAKIEVKFAIDANGILNVTATDVYSNNEQTITVKSNRLSEKEIARCADVAAQFREQDQKMRDAIMARITADDMINAALESLPKLREKKVSVGQIDEAVAESRRLLERGDIEELRFSVNRLKKLMDEAYAEEARKQGSKEAGKMLKKLHLEDGEEIQLRSTGALSAVPTGRWRLGEWVKTDRRLFFLQGGDVNFTANLDCLIAIERCQREYSFGTKPCLKIVCNRKSGAIPFWFVSGNIRLWQDKLAKSLKGRITEADIVQLAKGLGVESERLVWFLYQRQHATIKELAGEINAGSHMEVLEKIKREINTAAQGLLGRPIFVFRQAWADPFHPTEKVAYSWWFADLVEAPEPFYDIIDEGSFYRIIAEAPEDAEVVVNDGSLAFMNEHGFKNAIELPKDADGICGKSCYRNGILELRIKKRLTP